ncbi:MAG TPA: hypothetical protein PLT25_03600 [Acidocella sp.]|nr:hypothetical protein [Acidocella sp.]HQU03780.1 hypothetical protein [Acidocella sp.]
MRAKSIAALSILVAAGLAGCARQAPPPPAPAPAPVGHIYQTIVAMPPPPKWVHIKPDDHEKLQIAFNTLALKSALMVGALSCQQQDLYDAFMHEYQPHILADQHLIDAYFRRIDGRSYQAEEDNFVTLLANNQSVGGLGQGPTFCLNNKAEFDKVATLKTESDLDNFVTDQSPEPVVMPAAETAASPSTTSTRKTVKHLTVTTQTSSAKATTTKTTTATTTTTIVLKPAAAASHP